MKDIKVDVNKQKHTTYFNKTQHHKDLNSELTHKWNANKNTNRIVFLRRQLNYKVQLEGEKTKTSQKQPDKRKAKGERLAYEI